MANTRYSDCCFLSIPKQGYRLTWEVTQHCPNNCEYCFTWSSPHRKLFESDINKTINKLISLIERLNVADVLITGGEPLTVVNDIAPFLTYLKNNNISFSLSSTLYNRDLFERICKYSPRAINLSIDPPTKHQNPSSFKSCYDEIENKIIMVGEKNIELKLTSVINRNNYGEINPLLEVLSKLLAKYNHISKVAFNREYPIGYAADEKPLTKSELNSCHRELMQWAENATVPVNLVNWDVFHSPLQCCPAASSLLSLMPNGDLTPCSLLYNLSRSFGIGNLLKDQNNDIEERLCMFHKEIKKYTDSTAENTSKCRGCPEKDKCGGGCPAMMPIASNHISKRTCLKTPRRTFDHERTLLSNFHQDFHSGYSPNKQSFVAPDKRLAASVEDKIRRYVIKKMRPSDLAHTMEHIDCVVDLTKYMSEAEGASSIITVPASYFHDIAPREPAMHHMHTFKSALLAKDFLSTLSYFSEEELFHIQYCIYTSSYGSFLLGYQALSLEAKVVRDADWLDAIGARGIARVFAFGQAHGAESFGYPEIDPEAYRVAIDMNITGPDKDPMTHFYTKLLKISDLLQTPTGIALGKKRHKFMVDFIRQYMAEVEIYQERIKNKQLVMKFLNNGN
ncbi:MAG: radical SAM protein [Thermodesulfobacteriota bacterium]